MTLRQTLPPLGSKATAQAGGQSRLAFAGVMCMISARHTHEATLRTNIQIDDELMARAMAATGLPTKKATVEEGLRLLVRIREQKEALAELNGMGWEGDLDAMREGRTFVTGE